MRRAPAEPGATDAVYECVITDMRWDRQVEERDDYLAGLIAGLDLPSAPIEHHLFDFSGRDAEPVGLALQVLAILPLAGRLGAVAILRRYAVEGPHWSAALEAIGFSGAMRLPAMWDGLADDIVAGRDDAELAEAIWCDMEPWTTFARSQQRVRRIVDGLGASRAPGAHGRDIRHELAAVEVEDLLGIVAAGGRRWRSWAGGAIASSSTSPKTPGCATRPGGSRASRRRFATSGPRPCRTPVRGSRAATAHSSHSETTSSQRSETGATSRCCWPRCTVPSRRANGARPKSRPGDWDGWKSAKPRANSWPRGKAPFIHMRGRRSLKDFGDARRVRPQPSRSRVLTTANRRFGRLRSRWFRTPPRSARERRSAGLRRGRIRPARSTRGLSRVRAPTVRRPDAIPARRRYPVRPIAAPPGRSARSFEPSGLPVRHRLCSPRP